VDAYAEFLALGSPSGADELSAVRLSPSRRDYLAKSTDGAPHFLLHDPGVAAYTPGVQLRNVRIQFNTPCRVSTAEGLLEDRFAVVSCDQVVPELHELFIRCVTPAIASLPSDASTAEIRQCVQTLLELFRAMSRPSGREIAGLWAELFLVARSTDTVAAMEAWHASNFERFDFSTSHLVLEVKATQGPVRVHEFALEQLSPPSELGLVASVMLQPMSGGVGVMGLAAQVDSALAGRNDLRARLWANVASALGVDFCEKLDRRFDISYAERMLLLFAMRDIPAPPPPADPRIVGIRFTVDLTGVDSTFTGSSKGVLQDATEPTGGTATRPTLATT